MNYRTNFNSSFANRGMGLENDINETNKYYRDYDIALIYKKPTPIRITKTNYQNMRVVDGFFECPSTLDYNGIYKGYYVEFDAKETKSKTSFTINNIHEHQIDYIKKVIKHNGIVFLIVRFSLLNKDYILGGKELIDFINDNERKSIPLSYFEENCYELNIKNAPRLDYIKYVDQLVIDKCRGLQFVYLLSLLLYLALLSLELRDYLVCVLLFHLLLFT